MSKPRRTLLIIAAIALAGYFAWTSRLPADQSAKHQTAIPARTDTAIFAGGCFWCMESPFEELDGVLAAESGYTGGEVENPSYEQVSHTETGHVEAVRITFDPDRISYADLVEVFWRQIDPTDPNGQFVDQGSSYLSAIFVHSDQQRRIAEASKESLVQSERFKDPIVTPIRDAKTFYVAEDYHQNFYQTHPLKYKYYRYRSGRDAFLDEAWGADREYKPKPIEKSSNEVPFEKPSADVLKEQLTGIQFKVTQEDATEPAFKNEYWDNKADGIYVDVVSGEPLFSSKDKYKSGTGWPSFSQIIRPGAVVEKTDYYLILPRTEIRSKIADSHLGHVFNDGPEPTGKRYCMNSAAMRFVPADELDEEGYEDFVSLFE